MVNNDSHPPVPPFACGDPAPSVSPHAWGFLLWNAGGDCGLAGSLSPARRARSEMLRVGNKVSSFYGMQGGLAMLAAMRRRTSSQIPPVLSSFPSLFRLQRWTELNHSSAGGRRGSGGLAMHGVMRVLIARWLAVIAMLGLLALVMATSRAPCVPYGLWHTLQMNCR